VHLLLSERRKGTLRKVNASAEAARVARDAPKTEARCHPRANHGGRRSGGLCGWAGAALDF